MSASVKLVSVQDAYDDILQRTLARISCDLARLVYLASTRDYNTGNYHHDGLAARFSADVARKALEIAHRQVFYRVSAYSLEELAEEVNIYLDVPRKSARGSARLANPRALPDRRPDRRQSRGGSPLSLQHQTRLGNFPPPSEAASPASVSRMATPVTCPTISASAP